MFNLLSRSLVGSPSAVMQSMHSTAPADLGHQDTYWWSLTPLQRCNRCILKLPTADWAGWIEESVLQCFFGSNHLKKTGVTNSIIKTHHYKKEKKMKYNNDTCYSSIFSQVLLTTIQTLPTYAQLLLTAIYSSGVVLIATTPRYRGRRHALNWITPLTLGIYLMISSVKPGGIKYHFLSLFLTRLGIEPRS